MAGAWSAAAAPATSPSAPTAPPTQTFTDHGYTGQKHNDDLGLIYFNARYYVPGIARFASADTLVPSHTNPQSLNRYSYGLGNPLRYIDPSGHRACSPEQAATGDETCDQNIDNTPLDSPTTRQSAPNSSSCHEIWCRGQLGNRIPVHLDEWEIQLLILVAINEGGAQSVQQVASITWTILNRYANPRILTAKGFSSRLESILISDPKQYHVVFGDPRRGYPGGIFPGDLMGTGTIGEVGIRETYTSWSNWHPYLTRDNTVAVRNAIVAYNSGAVDPTNGADSFFHVAAKQGTAQSDAIRNLATDEGRFRDARAVGFLEGNGLERPWGISRDLIYWRQYPWP